MSIYWWIDNIYKALNALFTINKAFNYNCITFSEGKDSGVKSPNIRKLNKEGMTTLFRKLHTDIVQCLIMFEQKKKLMRKISLSCHQGVKSSAAAQRHNGAFALCSCEEICWSLRGWSRLHAGILTKIWRFQQKSLCPAQSLLCKILQSINWAAIGQHRATFWLWFIRGSEI